MWLNCIAIDDRPPPFRNAVILLAQLAGQYEMDLVVLLFNFCCQVRGSHPTAQFESGTTQAEQRKPSGEESCNFVLLILVLKKTTSCFHSQLIVVDKWLQDINERLPYFITVHETGMRHRLMD